MTPFATALFFHILGVTALFGGIVVMQQAGMRLRAAGTWSEARPWLGMLAGTRVMFGVGSVLLLLTGLYMTTVQWTFMTPWVTVGIVTLVVLAVMGPVVVGPAFARIGRAGAGQEGTIAPEIRRRIASPALWGMVFGMNGAAVAMIWLMTNKPGWTGAIAIPVVLAAIAAILGGVVTRPRTADARSGAVSGGALPHGGRGAP